MSYAKITEYLNGMNEGFIPEARSDHLDILVIFALEIVNTKIPFGKESCYSVI